MFRQLLTPKNGVGRAALRLAKHRAAQADRLANAPKVDEPSRQVRRALARAKFKQRVSVGKAEWHHAKAPGGAAAITRARVREVTK
jgi:hypothetical protein